MSQITPDLVEWLVADQEVSSCWRLLASSLGLQTYVPSLEVSRRNRRTDRHRLKELVVIWRTLKPHTYNVQTLLAVLDKQGMKSMYEWVKLMTGERLRAEELESFVLDRLSQTRARSSLSVQSDLGGRSGSTPRPHSCYYSLPPSPWPQTPTHSRPLSALSDYQERSSVSPLRARDQAVRSSVSPLRARDHEVRRSVSPLRAQDQAVRSSNSPIRVQDRAARNPARGQGVGGKEGGQGRGGVFHTLYQPEVVRRVQELKPHVRHSSYLPLGREDNLATILESPKTEGMKQFEAAFTLYRGGEGGELKKDKEPEIQTEKYFDNLISMIEESARGLEL